MGLYPYHFPFGLPGPAPGPESSAPREGPVFCANPTFPPTEKTNAGSFPVPVASALQGGVTGTAYSETITAQGGTSPYSFAITSGALPTGITMTSGGIISGTPTASGTFSFTVTVTDANGNSGSQPFTIVIATPPPPANYGYVA